ncbi:AraC family transcriptional regulator [Tenacibaculum tangerinum]|uniref:AraC family transcriptional regulator n=1 Tax=Tenacibaculum tangerinum TaxID=3038772 RepID=A0ABY8L0E4_9FLAO|nr:AraC family transcriptional regulator [Tenacibaculum tangerinum]WGH74815.1 AraC family transcriptional regulator [Tenacibaculum tangerinum]
MNTNFNFFNSLIISGALQGIIFAAVVLLYNKHKSKSNFFLAQVVLYLSLNNLYYWFVDVGLSQNIPYYENLYIPLNLLILPCYYCFVISYFNIKEKTTYLFVPFLISLLTHIFLLVYKLFFTSHFIISQKNIHFFYYAEEYLSALFTLFVIFKTFSFIKNYEKNAKEYSSKIVKKETKWLKNLLFFGIFISILWILLTLFSQYFNIYQLQTNNTYFLWLSISFLVYWLGYNGIYYNGIFNQRTEIRKQTIDNKAIKTRPSSEKGKQQVEDFKAIIKNQKLYLNPQFSLSLFSKKLDLSESYLSHIFNQNSSINFSEYVNKLRVEEALKLLKNSQFKNYTIVAIGLEAGFNSKSTFYHNFKKEVGVTPTQYRKENMS